MQLQCTIAGQGAVLGGGESITAEELIIGQIGSFVLATISFALGCLFYPSVSSSLFSVILFVDP